MVKRKNPFPGLRPFEFKDSEFFFGREKHIGQLRLKLEINQFIAVVGRSGDGKSSLVKAGLLPQLDAENRQSSNDEDRWIFREMRPQGKPIEKLAELVESFVQERADEFDRDSAETRHTRAIARLKQSSSGLAELISEVLYDTSSKIVLVIDQFEELFRFKRSHDRPEDFEEAAAFVALLLRASESSSPRIHVILTMRSDYLGDCPQFRGLAEAINESQFLVPRPNRAERKDAITKPLKKAGAAIEPVLVQRLLNDAGDEPDMLPVLQHALMRTWEKAVERCDQNDPNEPPTLQLKDYNRIGGMKSAISDHADKIFSEFNAVEKRATQTLMKAIVDVDSENRITRRTPPLRLTELEQLFDVKELDALRNVINDLRGQGRHFILPPSSKKVLESSDAIDVGHEAFIRGWGEVKTWLKKETKDASNYRSMLDVAGVDGAKLGGSFGQQLANWFDKFKPREAWANRYGGQLNSVVDLVERSRRSLRFEKFLKWMPYAMGALLVATFIFFFNWYSETSLRREAEVARNLAENALRQTEEALAEAVRERFRADEATLRAVKARLEAQEALADAIRQRQRADIATLEAQKALADAIRQRQRADIATIQRQVTLGVEQAITGSADITLRLTKTLLSDPGMTNEVPSILAMANLALYSPYKSNQWFTTESQYIAMASDSSGSNIFLVETNGMIMQVDPNLPNNRRYFNFSAGRNVKSLSASKDGNRLLSLYSDGEVAMWDISSSEQVLITDIRLQNTNFDQDKSERISQEPKDRPGSEQRNLPANLAADISPDGKWFTVSIGKIVQIYNENGVLVRGFSHLGDVNDAKISPDARTLVTVTSNNIGKVWDVESGQLLGNLVGHGNSIVHVDVSPQSDRILTVSSSGQAILWNASNFEQIVSLNNVRGNLLKGIFSHDGRGIFTTNSDGTVQFWDTDTGEEIYSSPIGNFFLADLVVLLENNNLMTLNRNASVEVWNTPSFVAEVYNGETLKNAPLWVQQYRNTYTGATWKNSNDPASVFGQLGMGDYANAYGIIGFSSLYLDVAVSPEKDSVAAMLQNLNIKSWHFLTTQKEVLERLNTLEIEELSTEEMCTYGFLDNCR